MKPFLFFLILFLSIVCNGQHKFETVERDEIKKHAPDYPNLLKRFNTFDTTLTVNDYRLLYYGFAFQKQYKPDANHNKREILQLINDKKYQQAVKLCDSVLQQMPISLTGNYLEALALNELDASETKVLKYRNRYRKLRDAILNSGNGFKCETAFKVIYTLDAEDLMFRYFEIAGNPSQHAESPSCVSYSINPTKYFNASKIYFERF